MHNDFSPDNTLISADASRVCGIIDFGDVTVTALVNDVAIAAAYQLSDEPDLLAPALDLIAGYHATTPLTAAELDLLPDLILARIVARIIISEWRAERFPENRAYVLRNTPRAWEHLHRWLSIPAEQITARILRRRAMRDTATMVNGFDMSSVDALDPELRRIVERRASLLGPAYKLFYRNPVRVVRAEGVHLFDADGQAYLDAYNNVPSVGHCHPRVTEAIARQAATLNTHTRYASELILDYAERLLGTYPAELGNVMFTCTGSEAVDLALRIARFQTGGEGTIITANAYHGVTTAAAEISPSLGPAVPLGRAVWTVAPPAARETAQDLGRTGADFDRRRQPARGQARRLHSGQPVLLRRDPARPGRLPETGGSTPCTRPAACTSPTRSSPASAAPGRPCGASSATASFPTWPSWASPWATACRSPASPPARRSSRSSATRSGTSTPSAATPSASPPRPRSST